MYNEVIDTLRAVLNLFKLKKYLKLKKYRKKGGSISKSPRKGEDEAEVEPLMVQPNKYDLMGEL
jgi:hypothetical protein